MLSAHLADNIRTLYADDLLLSAGTGNNTVVYYNNVIRSDRIYWLDRLHNNRYENDFFDLIDRFVSHLNSTCYAGITGYEFHYTLYEKGSFYWADKSAGITKRKLVCWVLKSVKTD